MATANYNEVTHSSITIDSIDPMFHWDTHFPDRYSRHGALNLTPETSPGRRQRRGRIRGDSRYKTQPITFDEIQEVDEDGPVIAKSKDDSKEGLKSQFTAFSRSMDGLVPGLGRQGALSEAASRLEGRVPSPAAASTDEQTPEREEVSGKDAAAVAEGQGAVSEAQQLAGLPSSLQSRDHDRRRRKHRRSQRRNKSIEEIPESVGEKPEEEKQAG